MLSSEQVVVAETLVLSIVSFDWVFKPALIYCENLFKNFFGKGGVTDVSLLFYHSTSVCEF